MSIHVTHTAECDFCGKSTTMSPINMHVLNAGYALPTGWCREPYRDNIIMCPDCFREQYLNKPERAMKVGKAKPVQSKWQEISAVECEHCHNMFQDKLMQCPWCGAEMTNGTTNYR